MTNDLSDDDDTSNKYFHTRAVTPISNSETKIHPNYLVLDDQAMHSFKFQTTNLKQYIQLLFKIVAFYHAGLSYLSFVSHLIQMEYQIFFTPIITGYCNLFSSKEIRWNLSKEKINYFNFLV